ncbi:MAG: redoxin domain-containing protein [Deltaproteobacteria bacterium]|nr:redoxin domain-containing protein [Deltaproteobacteria bacterium]
MQPSPTNTVHAPEFPPGLEWLNTERPLTLKELRGKIVLLDFWTYCCINCMHVIPELKRLEQAFPDELVVIGVHSAKFVGERDTENIRQAVLRYEIVHPVVNDWQMQIWEQYAVRAWPTLVLIDPEGRIAAATSGEGIYEPLHKAITKLIATFATKGLLDRRPLAMRQERLPDADAPLSFPGKVLADAASDRLFIADSNHHRILAVSLQSGKVLQRIGSGARGRDDGAFTTATFLHPQGLALDGQQLYVADTENHLIRRIDLQAETVMTIAGTGEQARRRMRPGPALDTALNSPWDLVVHQGVLYIAMAGAHQLWRLDLASGQLAAHAGSGREDLHDGPWDTAALAQPSGLATDGQSLYFADSEVSAIRRVDVAPAGRVETLFGAGLFAFGDRDGTIGTARLQHPLGVALHRDNLYIADTYNNKIRQVDLRTRTLESFVGTGSAGHDDGDPATFDEPAGISVAGDTLYVADTNNHAIRVVDLQTRAVRTFNVTFE